MDVSSRWEGESVLSVELDCWTMLEGGRPDSFSLVCAISLDDFETKLEHELQLNQFSSLILPWKKKNTKRLFLSNKQINETEGEEPDHYFCYLTS